MRHLMDKRTNKSSFYLNLGAINDVRLQSGEVLHLAHTMGVLIDT